VPDRTVLDGGEVRSFRSFDGLAIAYRDLGEGPVTLLHHGFASDSRTNWIRSGVADALLEARRRVVMIDARGHGSSDKPHDPSAYGPLSMARDASALLDLLAVDRVDMVGYSMGSLVAVDIFAYDKRVRSLVLGGVGLGQLTKYDPMRSSTIAEGFEVSDSSGITNARALAFRNFADATGADRLALAAIQRATREPPSLATIGSIDVPTLVVNGSRDTLIGPLAAVAEAIPGARLVLVPGDHISAVVKPEFRQAIVEFLASL
jgi:pimeloyl-ACP methyl ester carboxylesterase